MSPGYRMLNQKGHRNTGLLDQKHDREGDVRIMAELAYCYQVQPGLPGALSRPELDQVQLQRLNETLAWARKQSRYHKSRLPAAPLKDLKEVWELPLMDESAFAGGMAPLLCMEQDAVHRIVSTPTSGTTGVPKRIAFSAQEHRDITRFLASGMRMLVEAGGTIAVLFPCERPGGLGQLICEGIEQVPATPLPYGLPGVERGFADLANACLRGQVQGLVGLPHHIFALARWCEHHRIELPLQSVLLSADNVAPSLKREIQRIWGAQVFAHYGTTELGYGGAVECSYGTGQHIRETELLFEVIDPKSGAVLPVGEWGELVFTTLNRRAMPFIRYRSGDYTRMLEGTCACGSILKRIDTVRGRAFGECPLTLYELEDIVFAESGVLDFFASWQRSTHTLILEVQQLPGAHAPLSRLQERLSEQARAAVQVRQTISEAYASYYPVKRSIVLL